MEKLPEEIRKELEAELKVTREIGHRNRLCVILGRDDGYSVEALSRILRISIGTIYHYLNDFDHKQKTKNAARGGRDSLLSEEQTKELERHLQEVTYLKVKAICAYVKEKYGIVYTRSGMTRWLEMHHFVFKRPKKIPGKLNPASQAVFIEEYKELKAGLKKDEEIYFVDAVHPEHQSQAVCGWIKKGEQKTLQTTGKQVRLHFAGALCLSGMKVVSKEYDTVDADAMIDFFRDLERKSTASTIYVILDNARANKNKKLDEFLKTSRIKLHYLPPYSPNLNPIERLWKIMRERKIHNQYRESSVTFFQEIRAFFQEDIPRMAHTWASRINDHFQVITPNPMQCAF